jgi:hypothetical protein
MPATIEEVARIAEALPDVTVGEQYRHRTWFVADKAFAWERPFSKADLKRFGDRTPPAGPILALRVADLHEKEAAIAANPTAFFTIPHFDGYAAILVQLRKVTKRALGEALSEAWRVSCPLPRRPTTRRRES